MKGQGKRIVTAQLLLTVYVSMLLLSGLHHHRLMAEAAIDCSDCAQHVHHSGHLTASTDSSHSCLLCQFLSLVYIPAATLLVGFFVFVIHVARPFGRSSLCAAICHNKIPRAPPFIL